VRREIIRRRSQPREGIAPLHRPIGDRGTSRRRHRRRSLL